MKEKKNQYDAQGNHHGIWEDYHSDGITLHWRNHYHHGTPHGLWEQYNEKGILIWRARFHKGLFHGVSEMYNREGTLNKITLYKNGEIIPFFMESLLSIPIVQIFK